MENEIVLKIYDPTNTFIVNKIIDLSKTLFYYDGLLLQSDIEDFKIVFFNKRTKGWYYTIGNEPIAFLVYREVAYKKYSDDTWLYIDYIGTNPKYENQRYATNLMEIFIKENDKTSYLHVINNTRYTERLVKWYSKFGYLKTGDSKSGRGTGMIKFSSTCDHTKFWEKHREKTDDTQGEWCL